MNIDLNILKDYCNQDSNLRDYQRINKQKVYDAWHSFRSVMLQMPTGTGKTRLFVSIIKDIFNYSCDCKNAFKVLILVHRTELIDQIDEELGYKYNLAHGIIQSGNKERKFYPIQLASVQTLSRRLQNWTDKEFDVIIVDEAHHITADSYQRIIGAFPNAKLLGVTATPVRLNGEGFTGTFEKLIVSPEVKWFINNGYLSQYQYYSISPSSFIQKNIDDIKTFCQGDYAESELKRVCDNDRVRAQVVETYLNIAKGKKGVVYTINKQHNINLCAKFNEVGIKAVAIDCDTPRDKRELYIKQFKRGEYTIICNVNLFTEGFDCPDIEFIQLARPTKSLGLYLQQVGRGLRVSNNKEHTIFLDNVGLYNRFGFPSARRMWKYHFEGKNIPYEQKVDDPTSSRSEEIIIKRPRHQILKEGNERVFLIQTTIEKEYFNIRANQLKEWIYNVQKIIVDSYNKAFNSFYVDGLGLSLNSQHQDGCCYHICINKKNEALDNYLKSQEIDILKFELGNIIIIDHRHCNNYDELIEQFDIRLHWKKKGILRQYFNENKDKLITNYKSFHFSEEEIQDLLPAIINEQGNFVYPDIVFGDNNLPLLNVILDQLDLFTESQYMRNAYVKLLLSIIRINKQ